MYRAQCTLGKLQWGERLGCHSWFAFKLNLKVVSFSFYGSVNSSKNKERQYLQVFLQFGEAKDAHVYQGVEENLALTSQLYGSAWSMRLYYTLEDKDDSTTTSFLCRLQEESTVVMISLQLA